MTAPTSARTPGCPFGLTHLVVRMGAGDLAALGRLYDRVGPWVFAVCYQPAPTDDCHSAAAKHELAATAAAHRPHRRAGEDDRRRAAEAVTVAAFAEMWRRATEFDPTTHDVVGWLADCLRDTVDADIPSRDIRRSDPVAAPTGGLEGSHPAATRRGQQAAAATGVRGTSRRASAYRGHA